MTITKQGYFKCRYCKGEQGEFNPKNGNHVQCEKVRKPYIHPNCPRKLTAAFHFARNARGEGYKIRVLEEKLGVNFKYLHRMIKLGIEPNDTTEKLRAVRKAMFLPARKRKPRDTSIVQKPGTVTPEHIRWWNKLSKDEREEWKARAYNARQYYNPANLPR